LSVLGKLENSWIDMIWQSKYRLTWVMWRWNKYIIQKKKDEVQENKIFFTVGVYCSYFLQLGNCVNYGHHNMVFLLRHTSYYYYEHGSIITVSNTKPFSKHMPLLHSHQKVLSRLFTFIICMPIILLLLLLLCIKI